MFLNYVSWLRELHAAQDLPLTVAPGCTEAVLAAAEAALGFALEPGLRAAWQAADGGVYGEVWFARSGFLTGYDFLSLAEALKERTARMQIADNYADYEEDEPRDPRIAPGWSFAGWLPFASFGSGTLLLMQDYTPAATGKPGQIIAYTHDPDEISYIAPDFASFLRESRAAIAADPEEFLAE